MKSGISMAHVYFSWERLSAAINGVSTALRNIRGWKPLPQL
jgi:hypothetical protein